MQDEQIQEMSLLEAEHWWYRGLRHMIEQTLRVHAPVCSAAKVLDAGCGTGENLRLLRSVLRPSYLGGFDISETAVRLCRQKVGDDADLYQTDVCDPELHATDLDVILSCDVLSVPGIQRSTPGLTKLIAALRSGGLLILNLAAMPWLYSSHDVKTRTSDRVFAGDLRGLLNKLDLQVELLTYRVFSLFPGILAARLKSMLCRPSVDAAYTDLDRTPRWLNSPLAHLLYAENRAVARGCSLPWGSSVYAVARKP